MDLQFFIEAIKSGCIYDIIKTGVVDTTKKLVPKLREVFKKQPFSEEEYIKIAEIIKKADERDLKNEAYFEAYLKSNEKLKEIIKGKESVSAINQKSYGDNSPNINGNNNTVNYGADIKKK